MVSKNQILDTIWRYWELSLNCLINAKRCTYSLAAQRLDFQWIQNYRKANDQSDICF